MTSLRLDSSTITSQRDVTITAVTTINNYYNAPQDLSELQRKIADWLFQSLNYHAIQKETYESVARGTGEWFLQSPIFEDWIFKEFGTLWGIGIPGAGKTHLASIIVNHLTGLVISRNSRDDSSKPEAVICIYCRYSDKLAFAQILASILGQLVEDNMEVAEHVQTNLYNPCMKKRTRPTPTEILAELKYVRHFFSQIFIVVDALDELGDDVCHEVVQALVSLDQHILMTSRDIHLQTLSTPDFIIRAPNTDLQIFIARELGRFPKIISLLHGKTEIRQKLIDEIERKSDGMFLLAALQLATLKGITTIKSLRAAVANLPSTLDHMYQVTLNRINDQSEEESSLAHRAILWATHAIRPLKVDEFLVALSIDPDMDSEALDPEGIPNESTVLAVCCGLVTFGKEDQAVRLVHFTAHDFFKTCQIGILLTPQPYAISVCATYLQERELEADQYSDELVPFADYAGRNFGHHIKQLSPQTIEDIPSQACRLLQTRPSWKLYFPPGWPGYNKPDTGSVSHFGAFYGILPLIDTSSKGLSSVSRRGYTPLDAACIAGHPSVITYILTHSSEPLPYQPSQTTLRPWSKHTILVASWGGYESVVKSLLNEPGVNVNGMDSEQETALHFAADKGHAEVVELLLQFPGIDVNHEGWDEATPLHRAALRGHDRVVELLLKCPNIEVNALDDDGQTALHFACEGGHLDVVRMLLDSPAINVNVREHWTLMYLTPLQLVKGHYGYLKHGIGQEGVKFQSLDTTERLAREKEYEEIIALLEERSQ